MLKSRRRVTLIMAILVAITLSGAAWLIDSRATLGGPEIDPVFVGAGDIGGCASPGDEATAALLDTIPGTVYTLGDNAYDSGRSEDFASCYDASWGRHRARTRPAPGNHDYLTTGASGYFSYFGKAAGSPTTGYYSYDLGRWHIIVINSECSRVGGCGPGSPQEKWLRTDLAAHPSLCTLAYWHHPLFSSGQHGNTAGMRPIWQTLYDAGADVVLAGHDHNYERFAPQDALGKADPNRGIREFVVGTGGKNYYAVGNPIANSEVQNDHTFGVLKLTLHPASYTWEFVPEAGKTFTDSGTATCHSENEVPSNIVVTPAVLATPTIENPDFPFSDGFESGDLSRWASVNGMPVVEQDAYEGEYAVSASSTGAATYARRELKSAQNELYVRVRFKIARHGGSSAYLLKFRTRPDAAVLGVFITASGKLAYRNDVADHTITSPIAVTEGAWHEVQVRVKIGGAEGQVEVWYDGAPVTKLSNSEMLGTVPIGTIQLGDNSTGHTYDILFDNVSIDTKSDTLQDKQP